MVPVFKEYAQFLKEKTGIELREGFYWRDGVIIKAFLKSGECVSLYRICVSDDLEISIKIPVKSYLNKKTYDENDLITWEELYSIKKDRIDQLEADSLSLIILKLNQYQDHIPIVPISTGKDSMVTLELVRKICPDAKAIFNNTSLDVIDTYSMVKQINNCKIINPNEGFYNFVKRLKMIPTRMSRACCKLYKERALMYYLNKDLPYIMFMGMRNSESEDRKSYGDEFRNTEWGMCRDWLAVLPIRQWDDLDVWLYILSHKIMINEKYKKGYNRVGCAIACPYYTKSTWVLDKYWYPKMRDRWEKILEEIFIENGVASTINCTIKEFVTKAWNGGVFRKEPTQEVIQEFMQYKHIGDESIAKKYFNNVCKRCNKKLKKNDVGLSMKYFGRSTDSMMCMNCLSKELNRTKEDLKKDIERFKSQGCVLF